VQDTRGVRLIDVTLEFLTTALELGELGPSCGLLWTEALFVGAVSVLLVVTVVQFLTAKKYCSHFCIVDSNK
jgi:hypothetical protein